MLRNARDLSMAFADVSELGREGEAMPSSIIRDWRRVRRQTESLSVGFERNLGIMVRLE
jgi:hypothetical protein